MSDMHDRLRDARLGAGFPTAAAAAEALGVKPSAYRGHENGQNRFDPDQAQLYGRRFGVRSAWLLTGEEPRSDGSGPAGAPDQAKPLTVRYPPNATSPLPAHFPSATIGMYGSVVGGEDGKFILNGNRIMDVLCPPSLIGVQGAYGVFVHGSSMKPRYREGEAVFVNPHLPVRQEDYAIVQVAGDFEGDEPAGFVKQFVSRNSRELVMAQHQPTEMTPPEPYTEGRFLLRFPRDRVIAVHRIVWAGEG